MTQKSRKVAVCMNFFLAGQKRLLEKQGKGGLQRSFRRGRSSVMFAKKVELISAGIYQWGLDSPLV